MKIPNFLTDRNHWLWLNLVGYLALIVGFATVYYFLFRQNPQNFAFNSDITVAKNEERKNITSQEINKLTKKQEALMELVAVLNEKKDPMKVETDFYWDKSVLKTTNYRFIFELSPYWSTTNEKHFLKRNILSILDLAGNQIAREDLFIVGPEYKEENERTKEMNDWINAIANPIKVEIYKDMITGLVEKVSIDLDQQRNNLNSFANTMPINWSFWDFLYFSVITQATVGYGDMLPNSTLVRMFVTVQVLFGLIILGISINIIFGQKPN